MFKVLAVLAVVAFIAVALFVVKRVVPACRLSCGLDSFWAAQKRRSRVVVKVYDDDMPCGVDALNVEGVVGSVTVRHGELTICMLGVPPLGSSAIHPVVQFSFKMEDVQGFCVRWRARPVCCAFRVGACAGWYACEAHSDVWCCAVVG